MASNSTASTPIALSIAGSDPSGGAGIQADLKTFAACKVFGTSVVSALTAQNTLGVQALAPVAPEFVALQLRTLLADMPIAAVKTGMLYSAKVICAVLAELPAHLPLVVDPVLVSSSGRRLLDHEGEQVLREQLLPRATLLTPNLDEAAALLQCQTATSELDIIDQARALLDLGPQAVLIKGGHGEGPMATDLLLLSDYLVVPGDDRQFVFNSSRLRVSNSHGTGCTLSAAICANLAKGEPLLGAVATAKEFIIGALKRADEFELGSGAGSVHHFHPYY